MKAALFLDAVCREHDTGAHPENQGRLDAIWRELERQGLVQRCACPAPRPATAEQIAAVHSAGYIKLVASIAERGGGHLDPDTIISTGSYRAALAAAGCALQATTWVVREGAPAFALVRPPGHHARPGRGMGFCLFNNGAVAAAHALHSLGVQRVLLADIDAHHGNGTQEVFYDSPQVLYFSAHQFPCYPGTGHWSETGSSRGLGYTVNVPLPGGTDDAGYGRVWQEVLSPLARRYRPELILVSIGYDTHWADPLTDMALSVSGTAHAVALLRDLADELCQGRLALTLEGGYEARSLAAGAAATCRILLGESAETVPDPLGQARSGPDVGAIIDHVRRLHRL